MTNLNPFKAVQRALHEIEDEFRNDPMDERPEEVIRAQESANALRGLKASFGHITQEKRRLKARSQ